MTESQTLQQELAEPRKVNYSLEKTTDLNNENQHRNHTLCTTRNPPSIDTKLEMRGNAHLH